MNFQKNFLLFWVIFALLDLDPDSDPDPLTRLNPDPYPQPCKQWSNTPFTRTWDEPIPFDIQSTEQQSHCVNIILWMRWIDEI
jgi:hypothetical protein